MKLKHLLIVGLLVASIPAVAGIAFAGNGEQRSATATTGAVRATAGFHEVQAAVDAGYGEFRDAADIACIQNLPAGTMGIHYVNGDLVGDAVIDPLQPEALVYEPEANGKLKLVALEYIVFKELWDDANAEPPSLFGREFDSTPAGNRYGIPAFYSLHAWIWKPNPSGLLFAWNPNVSCDG
jgi:hypothetical protein